jgi:type III pantothenate kinase
MFLAIDCGNTNTVFAVFKNDSLSPIIWRCKTISTRTADEYASWLMPLFKHAQIDFSDISSILISSVVQDANFDLERLCTKYCDAVPQFIKSPEIDLGINIDMPNPEEVGADRLVNAVAARAKYKCPIIIIDFGTATTFDVVNALGDYAGGVIAPGINLSVDALHRAASALPKIQVEKTQTVIGNSTISAMQSGLYWGYIAMIEGMITRMTEELGDKPKVIATGGLAPIFIDGTNVIEAVEADLTLEGLKLIHERNAARDAIQCVSG